MLTVRDLLRAKRDNGKVIWSVSPETTTIEALRMLKEKRIGALLVLDDGLVAGIISERDFVQSIAENGQLDLNLPVGETMTTSVVTVTPETTIEECMNTMTNRRFRHLPVLDKGELVGMISIGDVVKGIINEQSDTIYHLENYISGTKS